MFESVCGEHRSVGGASSLRLGRHDDLLTLRERHTQTQHALHLTVNLALRCVKCHLQSVRASFCGRADECQKSNLCLAFPNAYIISRKGTFFFNWQRVAQIFSRCFLRKESLAHAIDAAIGFTPFPFLPSLGHLSSPHRLCLDDFSLSDGRKCRFACPAGSFASYASHARLFVCLLCTHRTSIAPVTCLLVSSHLSIAAATTPRTAGVRTSAYKSATFVRANLAFPAQSTVLAGKTFWFDHCAS